MRWTGWLPPAGTVCIGKEGFHIVGFGIGGKVASRRRIKRPAVASPSSPLEYKASAWAISMGGTNIGT